MPPQIRLLPIFPLPTILARDLPLFLFLGCRALKLDGALTSGLISKYPPMSKTSSRTTARKLQKEWGVEARHALYHHDGSWYHRLEDFPAALFDPNGYVRFETKAAYLNAPQLQHGAHLHVDGGICGLPGYKVGSAVLSAEATAVLRHLVGLIDAGAIKPGRPETYVGYKRIHEELKLVLRAESYGDSLTRQGLGALAEWTHKLNFPAVTGIVIDTVTKRPGVGYFSLFARDNDAYEWWEEEIRRSIEFDWHRYLPPPSVRPTPPAVDIKPPERIPTTTYRILRDTELARRVKANCRYECQICGHTLILPDGSAYAEAHHIKPLGAPHEGPDIEENILCVCPNHHAALDYGAIRITKAQLNGHHRDVVGDDFIAYHNRHIAETCPSGAPS